MSPKLSVVIPVRDGIDFVRRAIESAQAIPLSALEIVVVDDGSTDGTLGLLEDMATSDSRIVVVRRTSDHGVSAARNAGIATARSDFICFLDADDYLRPESIAARASYHAAHPEIVFSFSSYQTLLPDDVLEDRYDDHCPLFQKAVGKLQGIATLGRSAFRLLYAENPVCTSGVIARRETLMALGGFDRTLRQAEDWDMWIRLSRAGSVAYSPVPELVHMARPGSLSSDVGDRTRHIAIVVKRHRLHAFLDSPATVLRAASYIQLAKAELARGCRRDWLALARYAAALALSPSLPLLRETARAAAVVVGLRSSGVPTLGMRVAIARGAHERNNT